MADQQGFDPKVPGTESTAAQSGPASTVAEGKGKEKQPIQDVSMGEESSEDDEDDSGAENADPEPEEEDEDNMEEIDTSNIVQGRTRGHKIDFAKANADNDLPESDDEDDDFEGDEDDAMQE